MSYDEDAELTRYVWAHFAHLLSDFERHVGRAGTGREKAAASGNPVMSRVLSERRVAGVTSPLPRCGGLRPPGLRAATPATRRIAGGRGYLAGKALAYMGGTVGLMWFALHVLIVVLLIMEAGRGPTAGISPG